MIHSLYHSFSFCDKLKSRGDNMTVGVYNNQFTPETQIYILKGVECDAMNNTYWGVFNNKEEQLQFFLNNFEHKVFNDFTYQRVNGVVNIEGDFDEIRKYNYMIYKNRKAGAGNKWIYCFITQVGYVSESVCSISFETDVMQTWRFEIEDSFLPSFIAYEHRDRWYKQTADQPLQPCLNTQPENIEMGTEMISYQIDKLFSDTINDWCFAVVTLTESASRNDKDRNPKGSLVLGTPTPLYYYIFPFNTKTGAGFYNDLTCIDNGGSSHTITNLSDAYGAITQTSLWVNKCANISVVQNINGITIENGKVKLDSHFKVDLCYGGSAEIDTYYIMPLQYPTFQTLNINHETSNKIDLVQIMKNRIDQKESKLFWYPFCYSMVTTNNGSFKFYKNELWRDLNSIYFTMISSISSSKTDYMPLDYKYYTYNNFLSALSESFEDGYEINLPIVSDYTASLMQSSRNSMNAGLNNTIRSNEASMAIASATGNAMTSIANTQNSISLSNNRESALNQLYNQDALDTLTLKNGLMSSGNALVGTIANGLTGNIGGMVSSAMGSVNSSLGGMFQMDYQNQVLKNNINTQTNIASNNAYLNSAVTGIQNSLRNQTTKYQAETNIQNAIDSYNAKLRDARATADTIVTGGSDAIRYFDLGLYIPWFYVLTPTYEYIQKAKQTFNIRGYATNLVELPNLHTRKSWNYIQTVKCNIVSHDIDVVDLERIKQCFDNGITLWHTKDIANYTLNNDELADPSQVDKYGSLYDHKQ